jgi:hypothetical protein
MHECNAHIGVLLIYGLQYWDITSENLGVFGSILSEIKDRSRIRGGTNFIHERRESNFEAHNLAKMASTLPVGRYVWLLEPPERLNVPVILNF